MHANRLLAVIALSAALLWAVSLINQPAQAAPQVAPQAAPPWNDNVRVNDTTSAVTATRIAPAFTARDSSSTVYAVWQDARNDDGDIYSAQSANGGQTWSFITRVNRDAPGTLQADPDVAINAAGTLHAVWEDNGLSYARSIDSGRSWSTSSQINNTGGLAIDPAIAVYTNTVCAAWVDPTGVRVNCSSDNGVNWGTTDLTAPAVGGQTPDLMVDSTGQVHVVWSDTRNGPRDIYYARWSGKTWSTATKLNTDAGSAVQLYPSIAINGSALVVGWQDNRSGTQVYARYSSNLGSTWSASDGQVSDAGNVIGAPALTAGRSALWATWLVLSGSNYIAYADTGTSTWGADAAITTTTQPRQDIAATGNITNVWSGWSQNDAIWNAARATSWGNTYQVSNAGEATQLYAALGVANNGDLFAAWNDNRATPGLHTAKSVDGGITWGTNNFVSGSADSGQPALAVTGTQTLHMAWRQEDYNYWRMYYNRSTDGGATWLTATAMMSVMQEHRPQIAGSSPIEESPDVAVLGNNVFMSWAANGALYLAKSTDGGSTWGAPTNVFTQVSGSDVVATGKVRIQASYNFSNRIVLAWTNNYTRTCSAYSMDDGATWPRLCFNAGDATTAQNPVIAFQGGKAYVFWNDDRNGGQQHVYGGVWNWDGTLYQNSQRLDASTASATFPTAVNTLEGKVHVAWQDTRNGNDDVYWAQSINGGIDWQAAVRVNDDTGTYPQQRPALAHNGVYSTSKVWTVWQDFRRANWDIYATTITRTCDVPLTGVGITGPTTSLIGQQVVLASIITPSNASTPIGYEWLNPPNPVQNTSSATYTWSTYGDQPVTLTASSCSAFSKVQTVQVKCPLPVTAVHFDAPASVEAGELFTLTAVITPSAVSSPLNVQWTPEPEAGQGTTQAQFRLHNSNLPNESKLISVQALNCDGTWGGTAVDNHSITVHDTVAPVWSNFQPSGWISQSATGYSVPFTITVQDVGSGLQITGAKVAFANNGLGSLGAWEALTCTGSNETFDAQTCTGQHDFQHGSGAPSGGVYSYNWVRVVMSEALTAGAHAAFNDAAIYIDITPPNNPTALSLLTPPNQVPTNTWLASATMQAAWSGDATDTTYGRGLAGYLYVWSQSASTIPDWTTPGVTSVAADHFTATTQIPADGQGWYFHFRTVDLNGLMASPLHLGPYWLDGNPPTVPLKESSTPPTGIWTNDITPTVRWYPSTDSGSLIGGYSYVWDTNSYTDPGPFLDPVSFGGGVFSTTSAPLDMDSDNWWFHVNACDNATPLRNCSLPLNVGPFRVDTVAPYSQSVLAEPVWNNWTNDNTIVAYWQHTQPLYTSPEQRYSYVWDVYSSTVPWATANLITTAVNITLNHTLADGHSHYFHLRVGDEASNWSATSHFGPFKIDTTPPTIPSLVSTNPITGEWTNDNSVQVSWQRPLDGGGSGIAGYSIEWDRTSDTIPDTTPDIGSSGAVDSTTSPDLPTAFNHYFHVRACDVAGNCGPTLHVGPFMIDVTPAGLFASNGSGGPGSEVLLTGVAFRPNMTVTLYYTNTSGIIDSDEFLSSPQGSFQVLATVPADAIPGRWYGFRAQTGFKQAGVPFSVTKGLSITVQPSTIYRGTYYTLTVRDIKPATGGLVIESDLLDDPLAVPDAHNTVKNIKLFAPNDAYSGTHFITVSNRIDNIGVQRGNVTLNVLKVLPAPPPAPPTITLTLNEAIRDRVADVTGYSGYGFGTPCTYNPGVTGVDKGDGCVVIEQKLEWRSVDGSGEKTCRVFTDTTSTPVYFEARRLWNRGNSVTIDVNGYLSGTIHTYDGWYNATASPTALTWDIGCEMPRGSYNLCLVGYETSHGGEFGHQKEEVLACQPFTLLDPPQFSTRYVLQNKNFPDQPITMTAMPQLAVNGYTIGTTNGVHPQGVNQTFGGPDANGRISVNLPEGGYTFNALACRYSPRTGLNMPGRTDGQVHTVELTPVDEAGPAVLDVRSDLPSFLQNTGQGKVGPFLSFYGIPAGDKRKDVYATFTMTFDSSLEYIQSVQVTVTTSAGAAPVAAVKTTDPRYWTIGLNLSELPAGEAMLQVQARGWYTTTDNTGANCGTGYPQPGPIYSLPIVMAAPPPWLTSSWAANQLVTYTKATGQYTLTGQFTKAVNGTAFLPIDEPIDMDYLGRIENHLDANVLVTETFDTRSGQWEAFADFSSELAVMCLSAVSGEDCWQVKSMSLIGAPANHGTINAAGQTSYPTEYKASSFELFPSKRFGPWPVYDGLIASYWGVINLRLSINFGILAYATATPGFNADLGPEVTLTPGANLEGKISLWVDILLGLASAGVDGNPSLCLSWPMKLQAVLSNPLVILDPLIGFKLTGRVWAEIGWWSAEFGPFDIFSYGNCGSGALALALTSAAPPSVLTAPAVTADGYGHAMATWVHNISNDPAHVVGVLYATYSDGADWTDPAPVAGNQGFLVTDPAVAFADNDEVVAVYTSNVTATQPLTWTDIVQSTYSQKIAYSRWNGATWTDPVTIASGDQGRGRVTLAGDPINHRALAVWLKQNTVAGMKRWQMEFSVYNATNNTWSTPSLIDVTPMGSLDAEPTLAFDSQGMATAVWVRQAGVEAGNVITSPFTRNDQRRLVIATWDPTTPLTWTVNSNPIGLPTGALMPSVGFDDSDRPVLAYALYRTDRDNVTPTGLGNNNELGYAVGSTTNRQVKQQGAQALSWDARIAPNIRGVEQPRVLGLPQQQAAIVYRGFGASGTPEYAGVAMVATLDLQTLEVVLSDPGPITSGNGWMFAATSTRKTSTLANGVRTGLTVLGTYNLGSTAVTARLSGAQVQKISADADQVYVTQVTVMPDLSIAAADFAVSETLPLSGTLVPFSVTVRNLGLARSTQPVTVEVIQDFNTIYERLIMTGTVPADLGFNGTYTFGGTWQAEDGAHELTARVRPPVADDLSGTNNAASISIGVPDTPGSLIGSLNAQSHSAGLSWQARGGAAFDHYRVYRATSTGTLEWLSDMIAPWYIDSSLVPGAQYRYAVSAVSDAGVESPLSDEITLGTRAVYLPLVRR